MKSTGRWELVSVAIAMGVVLTALIVIVYRDDQDPQTQAELKLHRLDLVNNMRLALAAASDEQSYAVMATSEMASKAFIEQAKTELATFEKNKLEFDQLAPKLSAKESSVIQNVDQTFHELQSINEQLSHLALQSSNRKAYALAFGPATELLQSFDDELGKFAAENGGTQSELNLEVLKVINSMRLSGLRIQAYLVPHIAEPSEQKMDDFERQIAEENQRIQKGITSLDSLPNATVQLKKVQSIYDEFKKIEAQIISLSRENSSIRSVAISLNEKRKAMLACQDALAKLENSVREEPIESIIPKGRGQ